MLYIENLTYRVGNRTLLDGANAHVPEKHRVGLVGINGSGKTTLLRLIAGHNELDGGTIRLRSRCRMGMTSQDPPSGQATPLTTVIEVDEERLALLAEAEGPANPERIGVIHDRLVEIDAHAAPARAAAILAGLGFNEEEQHRPLSTFSGGWRMRVALASVLFSAPDLLLLDEPTNHLDLESAMWLEGHLRSYPNTLLMVSHDRHFLDSVVDRILHLKHGSLNMYVGGYDEFERVRLQRQMQATATRERQERERKRIQAFVDRFRAKASKARQAQSRVKALERMMPVASVVNERGLTLSFPDPPPAPSPLINLRETTVGYEPDRPILSNLDLPVFAEDRIALLGANGNGKTTLARLLAGLLPPTTGQVVRPARCSVGYFAQNQLEQLELSLTAFEQLRLVMPDEPPQRVRAWLGRFGFPQEKSEVTVNGLSGGERTRLVLALLMRERPNVLILDEPTNHLDVDARGALIHALAEYRGAVVLISHDRHLIETTADQLWLVGDGKVEIFRGDMDDYRKLLLDQRRSRREPVTGTNTEQTKVDRRKDRQAAADRRRKISPLKQRVAEAEKQLDILTADKELVDTELSDPATYTGPPKRMADLAQRQRKLEQDISTAEEQWLTAQNELEQLLAGED